MQCTVCSWEGISTQTGGSCCHENKFLEASWMWKMTWSVHYHVLSLEYISFLTTNRLNLHVHCSAHCVIECCFRLCSVHVQQLSHWWSCTVGGPHAWKVWEPLCIENKMGCFSQAHCAEHLSKTQSTGVMFAYRLFFVRLRCLVENATARVLRLKHSLQV